MKKFLGQDISEISPTLGFDIQTLEYKECVTSVECACGVRRIWSGRPIQPLCRQDACACVYAYVAVHNSFKLNVWDVGGQQTIRAYWRNYFEQVRRH